MGVNKLEHYPEKMEVLLLTVSVDLGTGRQLAMLWRNCFSSKGANIQVGEMLLDTAALLSNMVAPIVRSVLYQPWMV